MRSTRRQRSTRGGRPGKFGEPGVARLGEIYLYARFRNAVPAEFVEEFGWLEPETLAAQRLAEAKSADRR